jgi:hypothetical protein
MATDLYKIEIFLPEGVLENMMDALAEAHAGEIGAYDRCFAISDMRGTFRPKPGANPYSGQVGKITWGAELKLEVNCRCEHVAAAVAAVRRVHPYEEPVINVLPLHNGEFGATQ